MNVTIEPPLTRKVTIEMTSVQAHALKQLLGQQSNNDWKANGASVLDVHEFEQLVYKLKELLS